MASYAVNKPGVQRARQLIDARQYVLDSDWGDAQPSAADENAYLEKHSWEEYAAWHVGLREGAVYRAAEWRHKEIELAAQTSCSIWTARAPDRRRGARAAGAARAGRPRREVLGRAARP